MDERVAMMMGGDAERFPADGASLGEEERIARRFVELRGRWLPECAKIVQEAQRLHDFAAGEGDQKGNAADKRRLAEAGIEILAHNDIGPVLRALSGRQIMQRYSRSYVSRTPERAQWAKIKTEIDKALMEQADAEQEESLAFRNGPGIAGIAWIRWSIDPMSFPNKRLKVEEWPLASVLWPADEARKVNLTDREGHIIGEWLSDEEFAARWPDKVAAVGDSGRTDWAETGGIGVTGGGAEMSSRDPWVGGLGSSSSSGPRPKRLGRRWVERFEWREVRTTYEVMVPQDGYAQYAASLGSEAGEGEGEELTVVEMGAEELREFRKVRRDEYGEEVPKQYVIERPKWSYRYAKFCGAQLLEHGDIDVGLFTLECLTGHPHLQKDKMRWRGMVADLVDPQKMKNVFLTLMVRIFAFNPKGTLVTERGVFRSRNEALRQFSSLGSVIEVERGKMQGGQRPFEFISGQDSPAYRIAEGMMQYAKSAIPELSGFNVGAIGQLGSDLRRISGSVVSQQIDQALVSNADLFDALRLYRRRAGRLLGQFLKVFFDESDIVDVVGQAECVRVQTDPATGQEIQVSAIPPRGEWGEDSWLQTAIEDATPNPDRLAANFESMTQNGSWQMLTAPQADTGQPLLSGDDQLEIIPVIPEPIRARALARRKSELAKKAQAQQQAQAQAQQQPEAASQQGPEQQ